MAQDTLSENKLAKTKRINNSQKNKSNSKGNSKKYKSGNSASNEKILKYIRAALFIVILIVVFYPPYLRGLYFENEQLPTEIFVFGIFAVFWVYKLIKKDRRFLETPIDYASFGFVVVYFLSIFAAVGLRLATAEWLKYCMYFVVFFMLSELADTYKAKTTVLWVIVASATGVSILGLDGAAGGHISGALNQFFKALGAQHDVFFELFKGGRIYSTLQYPNTLAAYLMAVYFVTSGLMMASSKLWTKIAAGSLSFVILLAFIFTISRGAYLIMPAAAVVYLVCLPKGSRIRGAAYAFPPLVSAGLVSIKFSGYIANPAANALRIWMLIIGGIVISAVLTIIINYVVKWLERVSWKVYAGVIVALAVVTIAGSVYVINASVPLELAHSAEEKDKNITEIRSVILKPGNEYRLVFNVDASMVTDKPYSYSISIFSRSEKNILFGGRTVLASHSEKKTNGLEKRQIVFRVPDESKIVDMQFINTYQGTRALFQDAEIADVNTGKIIKRINLQYKYLPEVIVSRLEDMQASKSGIQRSVFYKDGLNIIKDRWLLGAGGGAWSLLYFSRQSYLYWSTQAHNFFLQLGVETGVVGLIILLLLLVSIAAMFISEFGNSNESILNDKIIQTSLFTAIAAMFMHSFIDFDLSLSAVSLLLWEFTALYNSRCRKMLIAGYYAGVSKLVIRKIFKPGTVNNQPTTNNHQLTNNNHTLISLQPVIGLLVTTVILIIPILFTAARSYADAGQKALKEQKADYAIKNFKKAVSIDPFKPEYRVDYANLLIKREKVSQSDFNEANKQISMAEALCKYDAKLIPQIGSFYWSIGNIEKSLGFFDRAIELRPFRPEEWQNKVNIYYTTAMSYFKKRDNESALKYLDKALAIADEAKSVNMRNMNPFIFNQKTFEMLEKLKYIKDMSRVLKEIRIDKVVFYNMPDMDINSDSVPDQWTLSAPDHIKLSINNGNIKVENTLVNKWPYIQSRELELEPDKKYLIQLELTDADKPDTIPYIVTGLMSKVESLTRSNNVYTAEITTPADFSNSRNFLRLYVNKDYEFRNVLMVEK